MCFTLCSTNPHFPPQNKLALASSHTYAPLTASEVVLLMKVADPSGDGDLTIDEVSERASRSEGAKERVFPPHTHSRPPSSPPNTPSHLPPAALRKHPLLPPPLRLPAHRVPRRSNLLEARDLPSLDFQQAPRPLRPPRRGFLGPPHPRGPQAGAGEARKAARRHKPQPPRQGTPGREASAGRKNQPEGPREGGELS